MELHAIILCGEGKALSPLSRARLTGTPKALLPIANVPMIEYVLEWCERAYFPKITVISDEISGEPIQKAIDAYRDKSLVKSVINQNEQASTDSIFDYSPNILLLTFDSHYSGEIISFLSKSQELRPDQDFVLLPCDFITNLPPQVLIEAYRNRSDTDLGLVVHYRNQLEIEDRKSKIFPKNFTVYSELSEDNPSLLDIFMPEDIKYHKSLQIRTQLCWRYFNSIVTTKLLNGGIFFGSSKIFKIFEENQDQFSETYFERPILKVIRDLARRSWKHSVKKETIGLMIVPQQATFFRSNNLPVLMEANRYFMKLEAASKAQLQSSQVKDKFGANVGVDSLVGEHSQLGEKTNVKRTVIGSNCNIGKRVRLTGCLILNGVTIHDDVQLENCIIGNNAIIHSKAKLINCNVESTNEIAKGTQAKGDTLLCLSLEGLVEDIVIGDSTSESDSESLTGSEDSLTENDFIDEFEDNDDGLFGH
ncbi:uncharacterized protein PRCAT00001925001 [Priceomyces carsonii]|uniref:uncharacterized protein n=1 Tax=Priceomyces carsonii TaxID=28549 RepID=UPI002EDB8521|nr:unnamed protein product [Priceomyces carsonii]